MSAECVRLMAPGAVTLQFVQVSACTRIMLPGGKPATSAQNAYTLHTWKTVEVVWHRNVFSDSPFFLQKIIYKACISSAFLTLSLYITFLVFYYQIISFRFENRYPGVEGGLNMMFQYDVSRNNCHKRL